jgi:hypothetical protein
MWRKRRCRKTQCRCAGEAPTRPARARAKKDQDQGIDFVKFKSQKQENKRTEKADRQQPSASARPGPRVLESRALIDRKRALGSIAGDDRLWGPLDTNLRDSQTRAAKRSFPDGDHRLSGPRL